jgi:hypothetical protein
MNVLIASLPALLQFVSVRFLTFGVVSPFSRAMKRKRQVSAMKADVDSAEIDLSAADF